MKSQAEALIREAATPAEARQLLREYLQHVILRQLFEQKVLSKWVFHSGTALRIIYGVNRYSEDLDFHLPAPDRNFSMETTITKLVKNLALQGYRISEPAIANRTVQSVFIRFENLLSELGLTGQSSQKLSIKIEIDTNPPADFTTQTKLINVYFPFSLVIHELPSFLAGKLHAILQRSYPKGRDYYDLIFLLSRRQALEPNISYLQNALRQTGYDGPVITAQNWRAVIADKIAGINWKDVAADVEPFLPTPADMQLMDRQILINLLN